MPESYPSIGEAVGAATQHNIRLGFDRETSTPDTPLLVRRLPPPASPPAPRASRSR